MKIEQKESSVGKAADSTSSGKAGDDGDITSRQIKTEFESEDNKDNDQDDKDIEFPDASGPVPLPDTKIKVKVEGRDDNSEKGLDGEGDVSTKRGGREDERDGSSTAAVPSGKSIPSSPKLTTVSSSMSSSSNLASPNSQKTKSSTASPSQQKQQRHDGGYQPFYGRPGPGGPYHHSHGAPYPHPHGPPPPHYYNGGHHDHPHYRGPPPPHGHGPPSHYHHPQMPPPMPPHPGSGPPPPPPGHYHAPPNGYPNMSGRPGPPPPPHSGYGGHGYPPHHHPYHYGNQQYPQPPHKSSSSSSSSTQNGNHSGSGPSDSNSISSSKSKRSQSSSSGSSRKKRTIDGIHGAGTSSGKAGDGTTTKGHTEKAIPLSYSFRNTTSTSTMGGKNDDAKDGAKDSKENEGDETMQIDSPTKNKKIQPHRSLPPLGSNNATSGNIFEDPMTNAAHLTGHRRMNSGASSTSSLSVGGCSLESYDGPKVDGIDNPMLKASPKRLKGNDSAPLAVDTGVNDNIKSIFKRKGGSRMANPSDNSIDGAESSRFGQLTMNDSESEDKKEDPGQNIFLALSTSPINQPGADETPMKKNTKKKNRASKITVKTDMDERPTGKPSPTTSTTPLIPGSHSEFLTDEHTLNQHLRGQTFTPLPHGEDMGISPSNLAFKLAPSMSWSIAGDTPSLEDIAACSWEEDIRSTEKKRPGSTTSQMSATRGLVISPHNFALFKDDHDTKKEGVDEHKDDGESLHISVLSPHSHSDVAGMGMEGTGGATTPLPISFGEVDSENKKGSDPRSHAKDGTSAYSRGPHYQGGLRFFPSHGPPRNDNQPPTPIFGTSKPPTPHGHGGYSHPSMSFSRSPMHSERHDYSMFGHHGGHGPNDRIRNLRGRMPPGVHMPPMPINIPPPMSSHHPLTSPMGLPSGKPFWSPSHGMPSTMASPHHHHMSPMDITQSKRKCVPMKPPIPSKFQGDIEKYQNATVPEFTSLVNFPAHMSQKQAVNLPEGMRCCVMCGQACPCSTGSKKKAAANKKDQGDAMSDKNGFAIIPTQNKGLCTLCDVNVWVVANNGLEIKWCKGCKNFRPWASFGDKGLATKCLRCRERQREKYALQKEEKEKARRSKAALATASIKAE
eukprot:CAMPEP_0113490804 /NCGR_PEP_ID=MMETSP0014_2-20120614/27233_1 /TAXON_ID=2857 /ORGANISM="Nitzschia sp." /LENGTH=1116 /DNA_ID=CAMNT_0000384583 /DNA_START=478 /DNA_END=3826 /DNA_ORIENTATION=+ /assembly_acc=CAM_ASM_000159